MSLVDDARTIAPELAATVAEGDELRRLPDATWKHLVEAGFARALQPKRWGGGEVHLNEFLDAICEIARANPSAGWVGGVIGVHPWQLALFAEEAQEEMWGPDPTRMHSSSYAPTGSAKKVSGGYRLSGRWSFSTGCDHCAGVNLGAVAGLREVAGKELPDFRSFVLYRDQYRIDDNWHTTGMKGTGSKDVVVDDAFVPEHRTQSHLDYAFGVPLAGQERNDGVLYRLPWAPVFNMAIVAALLGAAQGFIDTWVNEAKTRVLPFYGPVRDDKLFQFRLARALWDLDAARTKMRRDADLMWEMATAGEFPGPEIRATVRWNINRGAEIVADAVGQLFHASSGRAVFESHPLARSFADIQGMLGHAFFAADPLAYTVGGFVLGSANATMVL